MQKESEAIDNIFNPFTILAIDDDRKVLKMIERSLSGERYRVVTAESAEAGWGILREIPVDMVISDFLMPGGMTGLELLRQINREYPDILTVLQSGYANLWLAMEAINTAGVYKMIQKPWKPVEFANTVRNALETYRLVQEQESHKHQAKVQEAELQALERWHPGITRVERDAEGYYIVLPDPDLEQEGSEARR